MNTTDGVTVDDTFVNVSLRLRTSAEGVKGGVVLNSTFGPASDNEIPLKLETTMAPKIMPTLIREMAARTVRLDMFVTSSDVVHDFFFVSFFKTRHKFQQSHG